jgi:hypothetical protein
MSFGISDREYRRTYEITANGKSMSCALIVSAAVPGRKVCKFIICRFSKGLWEQFVDLAAIYQERSLALRGVGLQ